MSTSYRQVLGKSLGVEGHADKVVGSLLGCVCGDVLGAGLEKLTRQQIKAQYGRVNDFINTPGRPLGFYTDDSEMTLALATSLVKSGRLDPEDCARKYAEFFSRPPERGYGKATKKILRALDKGADYCSTGTLFLPAGSFANGGAMRISPVGLAFRNASDADLRKAVSEALLPTHVHPEGIDGAFIQAKAVGVLSLTTAAYFDPSTLLAKLHTLAETEVMRSKLEIVQARLTARPDHILNLLCTPINGEVFQIHAAEAVSCALWCLAKYYKDPEEAIIQAVALGGDTDTIGALVGAMVGALYGTSWIPKRWFDNIENQPVTGRNVFIATGKALAKLDLCPAKKPLSIFPQIFHRLTHL